MEKTIGKIGTVYYCPLDHKTFKVTGAHTAVEDHDPHDIQDAKNVRISNWKEFHVQGQSNAAGDEGHGGHSGHGGHRGNGGGGGGGGTSSNLQLSTSNLKLEGGPGSGSIDQWVNQAAGVLAQSGIHMSDQDKRNMAIIAMHESSGDPNAINLTDGNAAAGHPSIGLVQCIQSTFDAYKLPGHDNIRNPVDNIIAGYRYAMATYGNTDNVPGIRSLRSGGPYVGY